VRHLAIDRIEHEVQQLCFAGNVGVQGHGSDAEHLRHAAYRHGIEPFGVRHGGGCLDNIVAGQPPPRPRPKTLPVGWLQSN
jgi:hypothetical protein